MRSETGMVEKCVAFCPNDETIRHLFFECRFARSVWSIIKIASGMSSPSSVSHMFGPWLGSFPSNLRPLILLGAAATSWSLWLCRNDLVFEKKQSCSPLQAIYSIIHWLQSWATLQKAESRDVTMKASQHLAREAKDIFPWVHG